MKIILRWKFILILVLLEAMVLALIAGVNVEIDNPYLGQIADTNLQQLNACLSSHLDAPGSEFNVDSIPTQINDCRTGYNLVYFLLFDQNNHVVMQSGWPGTQLATDATFSQVQTAAKAGLPWTTPQFSKTVPLTVPGYSHLIYGGTSLFKLEAKKSIIKKMVINSSVIILFSLIFFLLIMRWFRRNLISLEKAANQILEGRYEVSLAPVENERAEFTGFSAHLMTSTLNKEIQALRFSAENERLTAERMLKVIDAVPDFMLLCRIDDAFIAYVNAGVLTMTGYAYGELAGHPIDEVDLGITKEQCLDWQNQLRAKGTLTNFETTIKNKSASLTNVLISASLLEIDNAAHLLIICHDITDRKLVEAAMVFSNRQLNYVLDAASEIAIISMDVGGVVQMFNRGAEKMLGYRAREQIGRPMYHEIHDNNELVQRSQDLSRQFNQPIPLADVLTFIPVRQGAETRNWIYIRKNEQRLNVSLTVTRVQDGAGKIVGFLGIARDITLQLQAELALQELNYQLEKRVEERTAELEETNKNLANTMQNLQLAQAELVRSEKLTALGDIVAVVAHEINTPIGNCLTVASTLRDRSAEMFDAVENGTVRRSSLSNYMSDSKAGMEILIRGLCRSSELVSNFKQVAVDQTSDQRRVFMLHKVVDDVAALLRPKLRTTSYQLEISIPEDIAMDSFPGPIEQIVTNLINNATLHAFGQEKKGNMKLTAVKQGEQVKIEFSDDGTGIPEQHLNRIFDPFFTTKMGRGGTGLGLNIVHNIVKKMLGGQIEVSSVAGQGTTFVIVLPLMVPEVALVEKRGGTIPE